MMSDPFSRLARLRAGTRDAHERIETVPALSRLMAPDLQRSEYVTLLQHMHAFLVQTEPSVAVALEGFADAAAMLDGSRPRALAEDLAWFGAAPIAPPPAPGYDSTEAALGALYVIEGSGLGGRVIARHLADSLGVAPGAGGSFYGGLSAEAARQRWQLLCRVLEQDVTGGLAAPGGPDQEESVIEAMVDGARETFRGLERWLRRITVAARSGQQVAGAVTP